MALSKGATNIRIVDHPNPRIVLWRYFGFVPMDDQSDIPNKECAICKLCFQKFQGKEIARRNIDSLKTHLRKCHPELVDNMKQKPPIVISTPNISPISLLLAERNVLLNNKKDAITIYLEVFQRGFQINHIGKILTKKMEDEAIKRWAKLTDEKRYSYIRLMDQHNAKIEIQLKKIDEDVIKLREGKRVSAGYPRQNPPKEMDKVPEKKLMFNPVTWMELSTHYEEYQNSNNFVWLGDGIEEKKSRVEEWVSLSNEKKTHYTDMATTDLLDYKEKCPFLISNNVTENVVFDNLNRTLEYDNY